MKNFLEKLETKSSKEKIFFIAYIMLIISLMINTSKFSEINIIKSFSHIFQILSCFIALIKILLDFKEGIKNKSKPNIGIIIMLAIMIISFVITRAKTIVYFAIFMICSKDIEFKKIAKITLILQVFWIIVCIISSQIGIIEDYKIYRSDKIRRALGSSSPNCLMLQIFQIVILYLYAYKEKIKIYHILILLAISLFFYYVTDSRMGMVSIILAILAFYITKIKGIEGLLKKFKPVFKYFGVILAILIIALSFVHKEYGLKQINRNAIWKTNTKCKSNR